MHAAHPPQPNSNPWRPIKARVNYNITCITQIRTSRIDYAVYFIYFILFYLFNYYASSKGLEENYSSSAHCVHNSTSRRYWTSYTCFINIRLLVYLYFLPKRIHNVRKMPVHNKTYISMSHERADRTHLLCHSINQNTI